jgi:ankyrin repeat protein
MLAVEKRFAEGAQLLIARKANPNQTNNSGETPIMRAVQLNDLDMVRLLIAAGADPIRRDSLAGMSAMDYAKSNNRSSAMMDALTAGKKAPASKAMQGPQL